MPLSKRYGLSRGWPMAPGLGPLNPVKGDSVIYRTTILRDARVMRDTIRMIDNG